MVGDVDAAAVAGDVEGAAADRSGTDHLAPPGVDHLQCAVGTGHVHADEHPLPPAARFHV
ncbi:hypothetical protein [Streptomyces sp. NPDC018031]|uniref:hypothetical protein n=1 Tax=Streptomyces sp. NPDC018031 TaxID=3365033 RepID=UPI00379C5691